MNSKQRKLGLMTAMMMIAVENPLIMDTPVSKPEPTTEWKRKKCKSCKYFSCKPYQKPLDQACEKYEKRK